MKTNSLKKTILVTLSLVLIGITGCEEFLKEDARNFINPSEFYENESDADAGLVGIYGVLTHNFYSRGVLVLNHHNTEETWPWSMTAADVGFNYAPDYGFMARVWPVLYDGVNRANSYIDVLENKEVNFDATVKARMLGEAKFLRAFTYSIITQLWGNVPLLKHPISSEDNFSRPGTPSSEIYEFIKTDLQEAINVLPSKSAYSGANVSRVNKEAAKMLLAKLNMIQNDWQSAKKYVDEIIASGEYALEEDILDNWKTENEHGKESIFEIDFESGFTPSMGNQLFQNSGPASLKHPDTGKIVGGLWTGVAFSPGFFDSFADEDMRKQKLFFDPSTHQGPVGRYFTNKYFDPTVMHHGADAPVNWVVYRFADVLLMKAEIENEINSGPNPAAYEALNMVRNRANLPDLENGHSYEEFLHLVFDEIQKELFYEGHRFFNLKRRGHAFTKERVEKARFELFDYIEYSGPFDVKEHELLLPIPVSELDANSALEQNPGY
jgi:starch-binding outer membrane protein, SusD/RagB family